MTGLQKILKQVGSMIVTGEDGKNVVWLWDYANDKPRLKSEMTKKEIKASEKAKFLKP
jgi:major membrane immunogen (membrane-anchored lipoprotein)